MKHVNDDISTIYYPDGSIFDPNFLNETIHGDKQRYEKVGVYLGKGINFSTVVWDNSHDGHFFYNENNKRSPITNKDLIKFN